MNYPKNRKSKYNKEFKRRRSILNNAHHLIVTVKYMVNKFKTLKDCSNYKPFWKLSNGITLCESCHKQL